MASLEVCIDSVSGLNATVQAKPTRVELCSALALGGLTPSIGLMNLAGRTSLSVHAMIRPRAGDFVFTDQEVSVMCDDIKAASDAGLSGVVIGVATATNDLNLKALERLAKAAGTMSKTLHRVIDTVNNPLQGMEHVIDLGFEHILSSGGKPSVEQGISVLSRLHSQSAGRIGIMAGSGLTPALVEPIHRQTGITSFHASCAEAPHKDTDSNSLGFTNTGLRRTDVNLIRQYQLAIDDLALS